jgi:glycosyltransferase involved in cell wall biosynthesis
LAPLARLGWINLKPTILYLEQQSWRAGAQRVLQEVLGALRDFGPLVAFPEDGPFAADIRKLGVETLFYPLGRYRSGAKSFGDMAAFPHRSIRCALYLAGIIRQRRVNLIYINGPRCLWAGALAGRLTGVPTLFHLHMTPTRPVDRLVLALGARRVTKIVACSESAAAGLGEGDPALARKLEVIYNPIRHWPAAPAPTLPEPWVDLPAAGHRVSGRRPLVGVVGRITSIKGQHVALGATAELIRRGLNPLVVFVGAADPHCPADDSYLRALQEKASRLGMAANVWWAGYQENPGPFYKIFDLLVIPTTATEGLPMVALEAMSCGVPVIGSDVRGITEIVRHGYNGYLVPPEDEGALAARLEQVLGDPHLRSHLGEGAAATVRGAGSAAGDASANAGAGASGNDRFSIEGFGGALRRVVAELCAPLRAPEPEPIRVSQWSSASNAANPSAGSEAATRVRP